MEIILHKGSIENVTAEGLICPVDGAICTLGGSATAYFIRGLVDENY